MSTTESHAGRPNRCRLLLNERGRGTMSDPFRKPERKNSSFCACTQAFHSLCMNAGSTASVMPPRGSWIDRGRCEAANRSNCGRLSLESPGSRSIHDPASTQRITTPKRRQSITRRVSAAENRSLSAGAGGVGRWGFVTAVTRHLRSLTRLLRSGLHSMRERSWRSWNNPGSSKPTRCKA